MKYRRVEIVFHDPSNYHDSNWIDESEALTHEPTVCRVVGYLLPKQGKEFTRVAMMVDEQGGDIAEIFAIPRGCMISMIYLMDEPGEPNDNPQGQTGTGDTR